jgi:hypothetical protein
MDDAVRAYIDAIDPEHRPLFDRLHNIIVDAHPDVAITKSLLSGRSTIRVRPKDASVIDDEEFRGLLLAALD